MSLQGSYSERPVTAGLSIVAIGLVVGGISVLGLLYLRPVLLALAFGALVLLVPLWVIRDRRAYWLFLLVLSILLDVAKRATAWIEDPVQLKANLGMPASGTLSLDIYPTDVLLFAMILPWLARICLRRETVYFPKVGYIYLLYLVWSLVGALMEAQSLYLAIVEWLRQILYFISFIYIANNVVTKTQLRAIVVALFLGMTIASGSVIAFFELQFGTETNAFSGLYGDHSARGGAGLGALGGGYGEQSVKRSSGIFPHPSHAGYYLEYTMPIVLVFLITAARARDRWLYTALFAFGWIGMYFTFARSPVVGLICGCVVVIGLSGWSGLISRRAFARCILAFVIVATISTPWVIAYMTLRPETLTKREELNALALQTIWDRPIIGAGLNNSSVVSPARSVDRMPHGNRDLNVTVVHNYYLVSLVEVGAVGFLLFFAFFGRVVAIGLTHVRAATDPERKLVLVGIIGCLASISVHNFGDPFGGHMVWSMLWLNAGLICALSRQVDLATAAAAARPK